MTTTATPQAAIPCWHPPAAQRDSPDPRRPGWIESHCGICKKWLGFRPVEDGKGKVGSRAKAAKRARE